MAKTKTTPKVYSVMTIINGETKNTETDNLEETLMNLKPALVLTEMYLTVAKGDAKAERRLTPKQARFFFNDSIFRQVFMNNLLIV